MSRQKNAITLFMQVRGNKRVQQTLRQAEAQIGRFGNRVAELGVKGGIAHTTFTKSIGTIRRYGVALGAATAKATGLATVLGGALLATATRVGLRLADVAAETGEVRSLFEQAFTGAALTQMDNHIRELVTTLGLSKTELEENASLVAIFGSKAGLVGTDLAEFGRQLLWVGADLTASYGGSFADAMAAIKSGLSGEIEPLKKYGVVMTEADLAAKSASLGFTKAYKAMTVDEKILVRAAYIRNAIGFASGQALREAGNYATIRRSMDASLRLWQEMLGAPLLEPLKEVFLALRDAGNKWMPTIAQRFGELVPPADQVAATMQRIIGGVERFATATTTGGLSAGIESLFGERARKTWDDTARLLTSLGTIVAALATGFIQVFTPFGEGTATGAAPLLTQLADAAEAVASHQDELQAIGRTITEMLPAILAVTGALTAWGKIALTIGQVNGTIAATKTTLGAASKAAAKFTDAQSKKLVNRKAGKALAKAVAAGPIDAGAAVAAPTLLGRAKGGVAAAATAIRNPGALFAKLGPAMAKPFQFLAKLNPAGLVKGIGAALRGLFVVIRANPIAAIVTTLAALFVGMYQNSAELRAVVGEAWAGIQAAGSALMTALGEAFGWFSVNVAQPFAAWWTTTGGPMVGTALRVLGDTFAVVLRAIGSVISWLWHNVVVPGFNVMVNMFNGAKTAITVMGAVARAPLDFITGAITGLINAARSGKSWVDGFFDGITAAVNRTWNQIKDFINPIREFFGQPAVNVAIKPKPRTPRGAPPADEPVQGRSPGRVGKSAILGLDSPPPLPPPTSSGVPAVAASFGKSAAGQRIAVHIGAVNVAGTLSQADANHAARTLGDAMQRELDRRRYIASKVR